MNGSLERMAREGAQLLLIGDLVNGFEEPSNERSMHGDAQDSTFLLNTLLNTLTVP